MLRVLYLINFAGKAGTEKYVENLVGLLGKSRIEPYFAYNVPGELSEKMERAGIPSLRLDMGKSAVLSAAKRLAEYCRENKIDVIHPQFPRENIIALLSKRHYDKPRVVMTNHLTLEMGGVRAAVWRGLNRHFTPKNHSIIAVCREGRDIMIENGVCPSRIKVVFNGIEAVHDLAPPPGKRKELGLSDDDFVITSLARLAPEKGVAFFIDCLKRLRELTDRPFCAIICGDGELKNELEEKIRALGLEKECRLPGYRNDVRDILLTSDAYVCSSSHNEAMSFAILEAMSCGLPLVVTDVGGNRDLAETGIRCGHVVDYGQVEAFAGRLRDLAENEELRRELSNAALEKSRRDFNIEKLANDVYECYL